MLELVSVSKRYGSLEALRETTLTFAAETVYVVLGTSGCGKSTLLKVALGLARPDSGSITFDGMAINDANVLDYRQKIGYVIQDGGLFPHLTARDNVTLVARQLKWEAERVARRLKELSQLVQLPDEALDRFPAQLSGGQQQRIGIMRALMLDPDVLMLDEPLGALDPLIRHDLQVDLKRIIQQLGKTVIMVTHDVNEAAFFADEIIMMRDGQVLQKGTIDQLLSAPVDPFVTRFIRAQRSVLPQEMS